MFVLSGIGSSVMIYHTVYDVSYLRLFSALVERPSASIVIIFVF